MKQKDYLLMKQVPIISVIVPIFNAEDYLNNCISSILSQSFIGIELMLVDDGSSDSSGKICDDWAAIDQRVKVLHQKNGGVSLARYNGILHAKGEWCCFVDADDVLLPNALECLISKSDGYDLVNGQMRGYDISTDTIINVPFSQYELGHYTGTNLIENMLLDKRCGSLCRQLIKREILMKSLILIPREVRIAEDWLLSISIGLNIKSSIGIPKVVYQYNDNPNSVTHKINRTLKDVLIVDYYLTKILKGKEVFAESLFRCRLRHFGLCLGDYDVLNTDFVKSIRKNAFRYKLSNKETFLLYLTRIQSVRFRCVLWTLYNVPNRITNKLTFIWHKIVVKP